MGPLEKHQANDRRTLEAGMSSYIGALELDNQSAKDVALAEAMAKDKQVEQLLCHLEDARSSDHLTILVFAFLI